MDELKQTDRLPRKEEWAKTKRGLSLEKGAFKIIALVSIRSSGSTSYERMAGVGFGHPSDYSR